MTLHLQPDIPVADTTDSPPPAGAASPPNDAPPDFSAFDFALQRYNRAPIAFVREVLLQEPDQWQIEALRGFAKGFTRHSIKSGHGVGKSCLAAWVVLWFICTRAPFKCALTAPSAPQLFDVLWPELLKWMGRMPPQWQALWDVTADHITLKSDRECFVTARTSRPETPEAMAGLHSRNILLVADEASGIDEKVYEAASGSMSSSGAITLLIGNPTRDSGFFWRTHTLERDRWRCMTVSSAESTRVSPDYITEMSERYGPESNAFRVRVLGQFPSGSDDVFIPGELVDSAMNRDMALDVGAPILWGVDVARFGADASVLIKRQGSCVTEPPRRWRNIDLMALAGAIKHEYDLAHSARPMLIVVDSIGIGAGVVDRLQEQALPVLGVNVAESPANQTNYMRLRDELWGRMREWLATRTVRLPRDDLLRGDLVAPKYTFSSTGKLTIESKESMRRRGLPSCDCFVAGTMVMTPHGECPIETLRVGDLVITPYGVTPIIAAWANPTMSLTSVGFSHGRSLTGTGHHKVFCWGAGIKTLDALSLTDRMEPLTKWRLAAWRVLSSLSIAERSSEFRHLVDTIKARGSVTVSGFCIAVSGRTIMVLFQRVTTFITSMATGATMRLPTLNWLKVPSTSEATCLRGWPYQRRASETPSGWTVLETLRLNGTGRLKEGRGTANMPSRHGRRESCGISYARGVVADSNLHLAMRYIARGPAGKKLHGLRAVGSRIGASARSAATNLWRTVTGQRPVVPRSVHSASVPPTSVYNLTLARHNAYYANGILVFNSADALMLTLAQQGLMVTSANQSWLFDTQPVISSIPGME